MSYFARLVEQARLAGRDGPSREGAGGAGREPATAHRSGPAADLEEVEAVRVADAPAAPQPPRATARSEGRPGDRPAAARAQVGDRRSPEKAPSSAHVPVDRRRRVGVQDGPVDVDPLPRGDEAPPGPEEPSGVLDREEAFRRALAWVAAGPREAPGGEAAPQPPSAPHEPAGDVTDGAASFDLEREVRSGGHEAGLESATPRVSWAIPTQDVRLEPREGPGPAAGRPPAATRAPAPPPVEEVVEVSIGTIRVRVEGPPTPTQAPAAPAAPRGRAPASPAPPAPALSASRLARRFLRS